MKNLLVSIFQKFMKANLLAKILITVLILGSGYFAYTKFFVKKTAIQYQTATATKGTLIVSVTGSGQVASANNVQATTQASGVVSRIYVKDGDNVKTGDPIVELELDLVGRQRYSQALASYQAAANSVESAKANLYTSNSDLFTQWQKFYNLATNSTYQNSDNTPNNQNRTAPEFITNQDNWLAAEAKYKIQQAAIIQTQTSANSAYQSLQQSSPVIYAPISGKVSGMSLQNGNVITATTNSSSGTAASVKIANIVTEGLPSISVNLSEIDVPKVTIGDKATVTLDALPDKTFTGSVVSVDTVGSVTSGVTSYPAVIRLDADNSSILPNMSATANIITQTKDNVVMVPTSSIQTTDGVSSIRIMNNGQVISVNVEVGLSSDSQTEITSGVNEGDTVITSVITSSTTSTSSSTSPFGILGGARGGGNQIRIRN